MAAVGASALVIEVNIRGWMGFAGSGVELAAITVWLALAGLLSAWAFQRADGWWPLLAAVGVILSVVGVAALFVLAVVWLLVNFPGLLAGDSKQKRGSNRNNHRRSRRSW